MMVLLWWHWIILGALLIILEMFTATFASLWFGVAAFILAGLVWLVPMSTPIQVILWLVLSLLMAVAWFKFIKPLSVDRTKAGLGGSVIIGETGMIVVKPLPDQLGKVRFSVPIVGADEWLCRSHEQDLQVGDRVVVTEILGNELVVRKVIPMAMPSVVDG